MAVIREVAFWIVCGPVFFAGLAAAAGFVFYVLIAPLLASMTRSLREALSCYVPTMAVLLGLAALSLVSGLLAAAGMRAQATAMAVAVWAGVGLGLACSWWFHLEPHQCLGLGLLAAGNFGWWALLVLTWPEVAGEGSMGVIFLVLAITGMMVIFARSGLIRLAGRGRA